MIPSTGTPPSNTGGPEKDGGSAFVPGPHAQSSCLQQRKGKGWFFHSCHHFSLHLHPGCSRRDRRLQWLIAHVPTRGHCDTKESQTARHRRGPWAPAPTAAQGLHGASALLQGWKLRPPTRVCKKKWLHVKSEGGWGGHCGTRGCHTLQYKNKDINKK